METTPYDYDRTVPWIPQHNQHYEDSTVTGHTYQYAYDQYNYRSPQIDVGQKLKPTGYMPKARTLALVRTFKKWLVIASLAGFGVFGGLAAFHQVGTADNQTNQPSSGPFQATPLSPPSSNGFFDQQGGNNFGSGHSSQGPISGSSTS